MTYPTLHISIAIDCSAGAAYAFARDPRNLPQWAAGLASGVRVNGEKIEADSPMGTIHIRFAERNLFGILDHDVTLPTGEVFANPMRIIANGEGCEVMFTLFRRPEMSDEDFAKDKSAIEKDLKTLKTLLEE